MSNLRRVLVVTMSLAYGCLLILVGVMLSGLGEGSPLPLAILGSPLTLVCPPALAIPAFWIILGVLLSIEQARPAAAWLALHAVTIPVVLPRYLRTDSLSGDVELVRRLFATDPVMCVVLMMVYVVGYALACALTVRSMRARHI